LTKLKIYFLTKKLKGLTGGGGVQERRNESENDVADGRQRDWWLKRVTTFEG
jgi:hypothetical protein